MSKDEYDKWRNDQHDPIKIVRSNNVDFIRMYYEKREF